MKAIITIVFCLASMYSKIYADFPGWTVYTTKNTILPTNNPSGLIKNSQGDILLYFSRGIGGDLNQYLMTVNSNQNKWNLDTLGQMFILSSLWVQVDNRDSLRLITTMVEKGSYKMYKLADKKFSLIDTTLPLSRPSSPFFDKQNNLWIGEGYSGDSLKIAKYDGVKWTVFTLPDQMSDDTTQRRIQAFALDSTTGDLWVGTYGFGLYRFDGTNWKKYSFPSSGIISNYINAIEVDAKGIVWIGTGNGLSKFDGTTFTNYDEFNSGLQYSVISRMALDREGKVWLTTNPKSGLLTSFDGTNWQTYDGNNSPIGLGKYDQLLHIMVDRNNRIWLTTGQKGVLVFDQSLMSVIEEKALSESEDVEIFPNPSTSRLQVRSGRAGIRAEVFTVLGQSVGFAESAGESVEFSTDSLPTGAYFVRVWSGGKMTTKAFQVSK